MSGGMAFPVDVPVSSGDLLHFAIENGPVERKFLSFSLSKWWMCPVRFCVNSLPAGISTNIPVLSHHYQSIIPILKNKNKTFQCLVYKQNLHGFAAKTSVSSMDFHGFSPWKSRPKPLRSRRAYGGCRQCQGKCHRRST